MIASSGTIGSKTSTQTLHLSVGFILHMQVLGAALAKLLECMPTMVITITSRVVARFVDLQVHTEAMKPLTPEDAAKLMCLVSPNTSQESAAMLAKQCANIPYAVRLIGDSISEFTTAEVMLHVWFCVFSLTF